MLKFVKTATVVTALLVASQAHAVTTGFTEGVRADVDGTTRIVPGPNPPDAIDTPPGPFLGEIFLGDTIEIYGRIVAAVDNYSFTSNASFIVEWIFEGYSTGNGTTNVVDSGFVQDRNNGGSTTDFRLFLAPDFVNPAQGPLQLSTDLTAALGSDQEIFGVQGPGTYTLQLDGLTASALYDIRISTVPLPAPILLLMAGVAGLAAVSRRKAA